jgi:hypothetical protein
LSKRSSFLKKEAKNFCKPGRARETTSGPVYKSFCGAFFQKAASLPWT